MINLKIYIIYINILKKKNKLFYQTIEYYINIFDNCILENDFLVEYIKQKLKTKRNIEGTIKKMSIYYIIRNIYNTTNIQEIKSAAFLFIRKYAYSGMFRFNKLGNFNVPYGGTGYDKNSLTKSLNYFKEFDFNNCKFSNLDFKDFIKEKVMIFQKMI